VRAAPHLLDDFDNVRVGVGWGERELDNKPVNFVKDEDGADPLSPRLAKDADGLGGWDFRGGGGGNLNADPLDDVDEDDGAVGEADGCGDFGREVDVAGGVDDVDCVGDALGSK
jgi:hypothetical protein